MIETPFLPLYSPRCYHPPMSKPSRHIGKHSPEFLALLREKSPATAIRSVTHSSPLMVFWVSPDGKVIDAGNSHFDNPPGGDKTILSNAIHKGHLRGRAAFFGSLLYVVVYGDLNHHLLSEKQKRLLKQSALAIMAELVSRGVSEQAADSPQFVQEDGQDIHF